MKFTRQDIEAIKAQYPSSDHQFVNVGVVTDILDGDSIKFWVASMQKEIEVRLAGIDAPEMRQKYGVEAKRKVEDLLYFDKSVILILFFLDEHDRYISDVWVYPSELMQIHLVREGLALAKGHPRPSHRTVLRGLQEQARAARLNYWSQKRIVTPKAFRRDLRAAKA